MAAYASGSDQASVTGQDQWTITQYNGRARTDDDMGLLDWEASHPLPRKTTIPGTCEVTNGAEPAAEAEEPGPEAAVQFPSFGHPPATPTTINPFPEKRTTESVPGRPQAA
jgi:hypothetical protein